MVALEWTEAAAELCLVGALEHEFHFWWFISPIEMVMNGGWFMIAIPTLPWFWHGSWMSWEPRTRDSPLRVYIASFYFCSTLASDLDLSWTCLIHVFFFLVIMVHNLLPLNGFQWFSMQSFEMHIQPINTRLTCHLARRTSHIQPCLYGYESCGKPKGYINNPQQPSIPGWCSIIPNRANMVSFIWFKSLLVSP